MSSTALRYERIWGLHGTDPECGHVYRVLDPSTNRRDVYVRKGGPIPATRWTPVIRAGTSGPFLAVGTSTYSTRIDAANAAVRIADWHADRAAEQRAELPRWAR